jgi:ankyrin repeat protein
MIAVGRGHTEAVQCLLQNPYIEINKKDKAGLVAFMYVVGAEQNSCPIVQIFLRHGVDINQVDHEGITVLMLAIMANKMDLFECLVYNRKIAIDQADKKRITPLMWAVRDNNCPMIKILLERGADVHKGDQTGLTALMRAVYDGHIETIQCLLDNAHVAINQRTEDGLTALMFAAGGKAYNDYVIKMLLSHGADINQQDIKGWTALMIAISIKNKSLIQLLINAGANPELATVDGVTPLQKAEQTGDKEIIDLVANAIKEWGLKKRV